MNGLVVVITGSTRGIGRAMAEECARRGASVVVSSRTPGAATCAADELAAQGFSASCVPCDVTDPEAVRGLFDHAIETWGRIDRWVNNAGLSLGIRPVDELTPAEIARTIDTNVTGTVYGCRQIIPYFREHGGTVLNLVGRGYRGDAIPFGAVYASTKSAVASLTRSIAAENADVDHISINAFVPGMVETDFYVDMKISPRRAERADEWRYAMDAFGVPMDVVARSAADALSAPPGKRTGHIYSALTPWRTIRGIAKVSWYRATGKLSRD